MTSEQKAAALGVRLVHTSPLTQSWHFERYIGRRKVAAAIVIATTERQAWMRAWQMLREEKPK